MIASIDHFDLVYSVNCFSNPLTPLQMLLITVIASAWLAWVGAAPAHERPELVSVANQRPGSRLVTNQRPELVSVALHQGAQGLSFDLFHPQMPIKV